MRSRAVPGGVLAALALVLIGSNVYWSVRTEISEPCAFTPCLHDRGLEQTARDNRHPVVSGRYAAFYGIARRLGAATLTIPPSWEEHRWYLERVAGLHVEMAPAPMLVDGTRVPELRKAQAEQFKFLRRRDRSKKSWGQVHVIVGERGGEYVVAENPDGDRFFVMPAERYTEMAGP
jgi:hypothetical protein